MAALVTSSETPVHQVKAVASGPAWARYVSTFGRGFAFPCDALGQVPLNDLSDRLRDNYLYARAVVGNELSWPVINRLDS